MKGKTLNNKYEVVILNYEISEKPFKEFEFKEKKWSNNLPNRPNQV